MILMLEIAAREGATVLLSGVEESGGLYTSDFRAWTIRPTRHLTEPIYRPVGDKDLEEVYASVRHMIRKAEGDPDSI